jgi:hypothetical protein
VRAARRCRPDRRETLRDIAWELGRYKFVSVLTDGGGAFRRQHRYDVHKPTSRQPTRSVSHHVHRRSQGCRGRRFRALPADAPHGPRPDPGGGGRRNGCRWRRGGGPHRTGQTRRGHARRADAGTRRDRGAAGTQTTRTVAAVDHGEQPHRPGSTDDGRGPDGGGLRLHPQAHRPRSARHPRHDPARTHREVGRRTGEHRGLRLWPRRCRRQRGGPGPPEELASMPS